MNLLINLLWNYAKQIRLKAYLANIHVTINIPEITKAHKILNTNETFIELIYVYIVETNLLVEFDEK